MMQNSMQTHTRVEHGKVQQMSTKIQQQIEWRRAKVMELLSKGKNNQSEMQGYCKLTNLLCAET